MVLRVEFEIEEFKRRYPNLWKELSGKSQLKVRMKDPLRGYNPSVIDFIQRAECKEEALEVIDYMERRGEINPTYAEQLREIILEYGPRYFGPKREPGYYLKRYMSKPDENGQEDE